MIDDLAARAENGDQDAQSAIVERLLQTCADGLIPDEETVLVAEQWARHAADSGMVWPRLRLGDVLGVIAGWYLHHGRTHLAIDYAAEALAVMNDLIDDDFDAAEPFLLSLGHKIAQAGLGIEPFRLASFMSAR